MGGGGRWANWQLKKGQGGSCAGSCGGSFYNASVAIPPALRFPQPPPPPRPRNLRGGLPASPATHLEVLGDLADQALEGQLADEELGGLLVLANLAQGDGAGPVAVGLLHAAGGGRRLARGCRRGERAAGRAGGGGRRSGMRCGRAGGHRTAVPGWRAAFGRPAGVWGVPSRRRRPALSHAGPTVRCRARLGRSPEPCRVRGGGRAAGGPGSPACPAKHGAPRRPAAWMRIALR
jgi:hypothetical protein